MDDEEFSDVEFEDADDEFDQDPAALAAYNLLEQHLNNQQQSTLTSIASSSNEIDVESAELIEKFNLNEFSHELLQKCGTGDLFTCLNKHWSKYVPLCYSVSTNPEKNLIETDSNRVLFQPLEAFICNSIDTQTVFNQLKEFDDPPELCGRVFKTGEPSYFCRDCGSDPTCVLCTNCFLNSRHRYHRYKMLTSSGGGGYCDCGDSEAWKEHPSCDIHKKKSSNDGEDDQTPQKKIDKLPRDLVQRSQQLIEYLLEYIVDMLCGKYTEELPANLKPENSTDDYVTMLYNDEIHSYDHVMTTLKKTLNCDNNKAYEYATIVDKEGRSAIKRDTKVNCQEVKTKVETILNDQRVPPLETKVMHHSLVAHQYFAERMIVWLQKLCEYSKGLKYIICQIGFQPKLDNHTIVEKLMLSDSLFWKNARHIVHQLFISTYFMDPILKKEFAILYTKNYQLIWRNYVKNPDDTISLTDLAVQLFTVLSLSKYLITEYNLLQIIIDAVLEHAKAKLNNKERFKFSRNERNSEFRRAQAIFYDLKYCLITVPDVWTDKLRQNVVNGFKSFVEFLRYMHGMDAIKRCSDQHIDFEPEWESGFNLTIRIQRIILKLIEWCQNDKQVLFECYSHLLGVLFMIEQTDDLYKFKYETKKYLNKDFRFIDYDITKHEVSIHAPLTRLFVGLHEKLAFYNINFFDFQLIANNSIHVNSIIEPSLRAIVLAAQTNSGLWRRNGYSLMSQVYFYANVKCRMEMYDRDIQALQIGASLIEPNDFLVILLQKFRLLDYWNKEDPEGRTEDMKYEYLVPLAEEFLQLIIVILSERYDPSIGQVNGIDKLKREVIHQLCHMPMAHSDIIKNVYADSSEINTGELENVLREVATFKPAVNPTAKGIYSLKKEYYKQYSPFFYHYSKIEKTKSEEEVMKNIKEKYITPQRLPLFKEHNVKIRNLLDSDVLLRIINYVLRRVVSKSKANSDGQIIRVLYLIGMALNEEEQKNEYKVDQDKYKFLEKLSKQKKVDNLKINLSSAIPLISAEPYKLIAEWILKLLESQDVTAATASTSRTSKTSVSSIDASMENHDEAEKQRIDQLKEKRKNQAKQKAEQRRLKILSKMSDMQKSFIRQNKDFFDTTSVGDGSTSAAGSTLVDMEAAISEHQKFISLGPNQTQIVHLASAKRHRCILCQEDQEITIDGPPMVLCSYVQHSKILSKNRVKNIEDVEKFDPLFMPSNLFWGIHTTTCGHVMHGTCWQKYFDGIKSNLNRRSRLQNFNTKRNEYLCPLCETIANTIIPLFPNLRSIGTQPAATRSPGPSKDIENKAIVDIAYVDWLDGLQKTLDNSIQQELHDEKSIFIINPCPLTTITKLMADAVANNFKLLFSFTTETPTSSSSTEQLQTPQMVRDAKLADETLNIIDIFARSVYVFGLLAFPNDTDSRIPITVWNNCAYTIQTMEQLIRIENKAIFGQFPARQFDLLSNLVKYSSLYSISKNLTKTRDYCLKILAALLPYNTIFYDPINIIECDMFHLMVYLCFSMPYLYDKPTLNSVPCGNLNDAYIFKSFLQAHCVQILLHKIKTNTFISTIEKHDFEKVFNKSALDALDDEDSMCVDEDTETYSEEEKKVYELFEYLLNHSSLQKKEFTKPDPKSLLLSLKISLMPFIRSSTLFFNYLTDIGPQHTQIKSPEADNPDRETFEFLCNYLGVSSDLSVILDLNISYLKKAVEKWCSHSTAETFSELVEYPKTINQLIDLPNDYIDLISSSSKFGNNSNNDNNESPSIILCLVCGEMLSSQKEEIGTTRVGTCTAHAYKCGRTVGMFLRIAECQILLVHLNINCEEDIEVRGCFIPAPYLDEYGETDQGLRRGNPLYLCKQRYNKLHKLWLTHGIPDEVQRSYQNNTSSLFNIDWIAY